MKMKERMLGGLLFSMSMISRHGYDMYFAYTSNQVELLLVLRGKSVVTSTTQRSHTLSSNVIVVLGAKFPRLQEKAA